MLPLGTAEAGAVDGSAGAAETDGDPAGVDVSATDGPDGAADVPSPLAQAVSRPAVARTAPMTDERV